MRDRSGVHGSMHFSLKDLRANRLGSRDRLIRTEYAQPALIPVMPWLGGEAPPPPTKIETERDTNGVALKINDNSNESTYFALYRFEGSEVGSIEDADALLTTVRKTGSETSFIDNTAEPDQTYTYVVTSLDRLHHESDGKEQILQ